MIQRYQIRKYCFALTFTFWVMSTSAAFARSSYSDGIPLLGVDYSATMEMSAPAPSKSVGYFELARSGSSLKISQTDVFTMTIWENLKSNSFVTLQVGPAGVNTVSIEQRLDNTAIDYRTHKTERYDTVLGEKCRVWATKPNVERESALYNETLFETCLTSDGILLWRKHLGSVLRATKLIRRSVSQEEVSPPSAYYSWQYWKKLSAKNQTFYAKQSRKPDFAVTFWTKEDWRRQTAKRHGPWSYLYRKEEQETFFISDRLLTLIYTKADGNFRRLSITLLPSPPKTPWSPLQTLLSWTAKSEKVLGIKCWWTPGFRNYMDTQYCSTRKGMPLKIIDTPSHGDARIWIAKSASERPLSEADVAPPAEAFDWR